MKEVDIVSKIVNREGGTFVPSSKGTQSIDLSDYLLKSIWDKVFEIRTDSQGTEYIFGKLPMVTQYGITMYSGDGVDVPSLASGLPFDGRTIWYNPETNQIEVIGGTGGGSGEGVSNFWDLSGIPSWITNSKPKYTYSEIEGTPDLSGFATQNWIISQGYASAEELKKYIPISGYTEVSGEKNFTGGLKVNGSPIYYDSAKKYWKLEGDLLITGGVTMYGSDSSFTPSTIMDALLYDDATLGINSNGQLYVKGGTSGGGLDITALQNYLTQNSYLNVTEGDNRYLMLSGGTINGKLTIKNSTREVLDIISTDIYGPLVKLCYYNNVALSSFGHIRKATESNLGAYWMNNESGCGIMLGSDGKTYIFTNQTVKAEHEIWHKGNFTPSNYLPLSGGTISNNGYALILNRESENPVWIQFRTQNEFVGAIGGENGALRFMDKNSIVNTVWHSGNFNPSDYLPLSGGTINVESGTIFDAKFGKDIFGYNPSYGVYIGSTYNEGNSYWIYSGCHNNPNPLFNKDGELYTIWHSGNDGSGSGLDADLFDGKHLYDLKIWGQSFDGNGNVSGVISNTSTIMFDTSLGGTNIGYLWTNTRGMHMDMSGLGTEWQGTNLTLTPSGNVGMGTPTPKGKLDINGSTWIGAGDYVANRATLLLNSNKGNAADIIFKNGSTTTGNYGTWAISVRHESDHRFSIWRGAENGSVASELEALKLYANGNLLVVGGITMYSDQRKKTILNHVELSLKQIAEAPLIEHYYNSDDKKTTHVGSIAQYWASMNDWFCKLDSEGFYTMEIQNAALASAISIARELDRYETKTDKAIKTLKKRICELEEEVERLKCA